MARVKRKLKRRQYSAHEKRVLLTGIPLSPMSTPFGHPVKPNGVRLDAVHAAWSALREELLVEWAGPAFSKYRERYGAPWAERVLRGVKQCQG